MFFICQFEFIQVQSFPFSSASFLGSPGIALDSNCAADEVVVCNSSSGVAPFQIFYQVSWSRCGQLGRVQYPSKILWPLGLVDRSHLDSMESLVSLTILAELGSGSCHFSLSRFKSPSTTVFCPSLIFSHCCSIFPPS